MGSKSHSATESWDKRDPEEEKRKKKTSNTEHDATNRSDAFVKEPRKKRTTVSLTSVAEKQRERLSCSLLHNREANAGSRPSENTKKRKARCLAKPPVSTS